MKKYERVQARFAQHGTEDKAAQMAKYMRNQFAFYGLPTPLRKARHPGSQ